MLLILLLLGAVAASPPKIHVYVALPERDGFVDAGHALTESRRDLIREVNSRKGLRSVERREEADIVLTVVRREISSDRDGGSVAVPIGSAVIVRPTYDSEGRVVVLMEVGDFKREIVGRFGWRADVWQECAERVSLEVASWAEANRERLIARRIPAQ